MNNNNFENAEGQVMAGQEAAQQNMVNIVRNAFEFAGLNTDYLDNPKYTGPVEQVAMGGFLESVEKVKGKGYRETLIECSTESFNLFLQLPDEGIEELNSMAINYRYAFFCQVLTFLSCNHEDNRPELLNDLMQLVAKYKETEEDVVSSRAWMLYIGLLIPDFAA